MPLVRGILITVVLLAASGGSAHAWKGTFTGELVAGPALAGDGVAWVDGQYDSGPFHVKRAPAEGAPSTLFTIARSASCERVRDMSASAELVVVERSTCGDDGGVMEVLVNDGPGASKVLETSGNGFASCAVSGSDVDGGVVAVARYNCPDAPVRLHNVAAGTSTDHPMTLPMGVNPAEVRIAGRSIAVLLESGPGLGDRPRFEVVVWNRDTGTETYRANADTFRSADDWVVGTHRLELQADGAVLYGFTAFRSGAGPVVRYGVASPAAPELREIPGAFDQSVGRLGFANGQAALNRASGQGSAVFAGDGTLLNLFSARPTGGALDFDGSRLAWSDWDYVYNEPYPYLTPAPGTSEAPAPPAPAAPAPKPANAPAARLGPFKAARARSLKAFSGTATDADGDLALVRIGLVRIAGSKCRTLQASGRLKSSKPVGGRCVPTTFLNASGTATWKFRLRKRLVPGRYALYVQAVDAAGHAQVTFTKASGSLRTFRVK